MEFLRNPGRKGGVDIHLRKVLVCIILWLSTAILAFSRHFPYNMRTCQQRTNSAVGNISTRGVTQTKIRNYWEALTQLQEIKLKMNKSRIAKIAGLTIGMTLALGSTAGAVTIAELQAQINALMAQLATLQGTTTTTSAAITSNLTIGSTGSQVVTLQSALVSQGHLVMPAGVAMGYFGSLPKAA